MQWWNSPYNTMPISSVRARGSNSHSFYPYTLTSELLTPANTDQISCKKKKGEGNWQEEDKQIEADEGRGKGIACMQENFYLSPTEVTYAISYNYLPKNSATVN